MASEEDAPTKAIYQYDGALRTLETSVISVDSVSQLADTDKALFKQIEPDEFLVQTAETIFYAQGGGQPFDAGRMEKTIQNGASRCVFEVKAVRHATGSRILHLGRFINDKDTFQNGDTVRQSIDGAKRDLHSRLHTGGHILGLAVRRLASSLPGITELKAQHYPDSAFVEFQGLIEGKHKEAIQKQVDQIVSEKLPVKVHWWDEATAKERCAFFPKEIGGNPHSDTIRVMDIEGAGAYPCGGTHVADTSAVGKVNLRRISRQKGITKISYSVEGP
ncbi:ATP binding/alanine-tRNA ligase [Paecilomyces variotii No. 5]|uniref:ATP binding/alanine-tRNA ligase n=1 Tax=Byssochlamys spectabilis (strain No. 5 / NBRC 109023) TaxID=1356009 RepID=V5I4H5_BYSSN|nr:ATP binding/alanine-tRNA ligase [Paecilomyces variotii No. 5]